MSSTTLATGTPVVSVTDNRGVMVRTLNWNRKLATDPLSLLVNHNHISDDSRVLQNRDPRLFTAWAADNTAPANLRSISSLAGQVLRRESTDSGGQVMLFDAAGRPVWSRDGRGTVQTVAYDEPGRPSFGSEQLSGSEIRVSWRSDYGDSGPADDGSQGNNLRGVCVAQYDNGGVVQVNSVALSGAPLSQGQRFLASAEALPDWPEDEAGREALLEAETYTTSVTADARGAVLKQTDAKDHLQAWRYNVSGAVCHQTVTPSGGKAQTLLDSVTWSAAGQVLAESAGNGVTTTYGYDPQNQWLATITAQRGDSTMLQALSYGYDNTGNVTSLSDGSVASHYYRNQATTGTRQFTYDALYQLLSATGRENASNTGMQYSSLPVMSDDSQYVNYTRSYTYDDSGNLATLAHTGAASFTRTMTTESISNRSVQQNDGGAQTPDEVADWFDANGNLLTLQPSASGSTPLTWDGSNNLRRVTIVSRSSDDNDREIYQYSGSRRVRRQTRTLVNSGSGLWNVDEVRYLPGLELRKSWQETAGSSAAPSLTEDLHVITGQAGRAGIRVLHWETGRPQEIAANDQVRWSVDDNIGSLALELDSEGQLISREEYYPFGGTAVWAGRNEVEASYKTVRYSGKERDGTGMYYYGHRYYAPWLCRWVSADPAGEVDGLNLYRMVRNNPVSLKDIGGMVPVVDENADGKSFSDRLAMFQQQGGNGGGASGPSVRPKVPPRPVKASTSTPSAAIPVQQSAPPVMPADTADEPLPGPSSAPARSLRSQPKSAEDVFDRYGPGYDAENRTYPFEMMDEITQNQLKYSNASLPAKSLEKIANMKFTLRHYTSAPTGQAPSFNEIATNMDLVKKGVKSLSRSSTSNTNEDDWRRLGNTGFTFFLLSINGEVANRKFLANSTHYAEFSIDELIQALGPDTEFFASADLLHAGPLSNVKAIKGKVGNLKSLLAAAAGISPVEIGRLDAKALLSRIDAAFGNTLEIKIPGNVKLTGAWNKV
ncbi:RHS repeat-associated core domain-containing protein [Pseudescherichia sp.]|uniref:RHS repeat-associated core domain-containing protein n=1 Tax=Pseudescherichia sp. TaxID=2055881 RepID=UPI0028A231E5|nr:RHS repeat-associated core domain-containing protein [Pseudescherichia sp.]